jgi:hypothetical protein
MIVMSGNGIYNNDAKEGVHQKVVLDEPASKPAPDASDTAKQA